MRSRFNPVAIMAAVLVAASVFLPIPGRAAPAELQALGQGSTAFTLNLYRQLAAKEKGNIFFSPYSISLALAMPYAGAKGETAAQMTRVLGFTLPSERLLPALAELGRHLQKVGNEAGQTLNVANAAWLNTSLKVEPAYLKLIRDQLASEIERLDFCQGTRAQKTINDWVADKTRDRIKDLIPAGILKCDTLLVLTNAVYFLGLWADKFDQAQTKPGPFWPTPDQKLEAPFMHRQGEYLYADAGGWQMLELPYREKQLSMVVLLPKAGGALAPTEEALDAGAVEKLLHDLQPRQVEVSLPRFEIKARAELSSSCRPPAWSRLSGLRPISRASPPRIGCSSAWFCTRPG